MTGRELIAYIEKWGLEDCQIEMQFRDGGGYYYGTDLPDPIIVEANQTTQYAGCVNYKRLLL